MNIPHYLTFHLSGASTVFDKQKNRLVEYEGVTHADTIAVLGVNGFNWRKLERRGTEPNSFPVRR